MFEVSKTNCCGRVASTIQPFVHQANVPIRFQPRNCRPTSGPVQFNHSNRCGARSARHFSVAPTTVQTFADLFDATLMLELGERVAALALPTRQPRSEDFEVAVGHPVPELTFDAVKQLSEADRFTTR